MSPGRISTSTVTFSAHEAPVPRHDACVAPPKLTTATAATIQSTHNFLFIILFERDKDKHIILTNYFKCKSFFIFFSIFVDIVVYVYSSAFLFRDK